MRVCVCQCLLGLERLCLWVSGGEELCVWSKDFQLRCLQQTHGDSGENADFVPSLLSPPPPHPLQPLNVCVFSGVTALIELPKNHLAAAVDREIGKRTGLVLSPLRVRNVDKEFLLISLQSSTG